MKVVATQKGYFGGQVREPGDEFDAPEGSKASWFKPVPAAEPVEPVKKAGKGSKSASADDAGDDVI